MTLGRIIRALHGEKFSLVRMNWTTGAFVIGDILSFCVQGSSAGLSVAGNATGAKAIVLLGLFIQIISFGLFSAAAVVFYRRIRRNPTTQCFDAGFPWEKRLHMLFGVSALIMVRSIYRVVEYGMSPSDHLLQHEWALYVFDSVPMLAVMILFYVWYPSQILGSGTRQSQGEALENYRGI
jgi:RTA1 like protein